MAYPSVFKTPNFTSPFIKGVAGPITKDVVNTISRKLPDIGTLSDIVNSVHGNISDMEEYKFLLPAGHLIWYKYQEDGDNMTEYYKNIFDSKSKSNVFYKFKTENEWQFDLTQVVVRTDMLDEICRIFKLRVTPLVVWVDPKKFDGVNMIIIPPYHYMGDQFKFKSVSPKAPVKKRMKFSFTTPTTTGSGKSSNGSDIHDSDIQRAAKQIQSMIDKHVTDIITKKFDEEMGLGKSTEDLEKPEYQDYIHDLLTTSDSIE